MAAVNPTTIADDILNTVLGMAPTATQPHIDLQIRNTVREFLQKSLCWREVLKTKTLVGKTKYYLNPVDAYAIVSQVIEVTLDGVPLAKPGHAINSLGSYIIENNKDLILTHAPKKAGLPLWIGVALQMKPGITAIPDFVGQQYFDGIVSGTMARLHGENAKAYSSLERSDVERKKFLAEVVRARDAAAKMYTRGTSGWKFPYFASGKLRGA